jgi:hypothetical protein
VRTAAGTALVVLLAAGGVAGEPRPVTREIATPGGRTFVLLDGDVYEHARSDLGDLRVVDDQGGAVPYLLDRPTETSTTEARRPEIRNRGFRRGEHATATLDFGGPVLKREVRLRLSGTNSRRRVVVEGRGPRDEDWETLVDDAWVFAVPEPLAARYERVTLPENNHQLLRVTVMHGDGDPARIEIEDAETTPVVHRRRRGRTIPVTLRRTEDGKRRETLLDLDLGARHQPFLAVTLEVTDPRFFRGVVLERTWDVAAGQQPSWTSLRDDVIYRIPRAQPTLIAARPGESVPGTDRAGQATGPSEKLTIEAEERTRRLRVRIVNRDDAPLAVTAASVLVPEERLVFEAQPGRSYRLTYGRPELPAPQYDLQRTVGDAAAWAGAAQEGRMRAPEAIPTPAPPLPPWSDRYPALLWAGLLLVVAALGLATWRALARSEA